MQTHKHPHWRASKAMQMRARELRRAMTPAERKLWQHIRYGQLGAQFRKQHAVGPYIVDFFCARSKLVVEIDGDGHADPEQAEYDATRTEWLNAQKHFRVIRFWNNDVLRNIEMVLAKICENLAIERYRMPQNNIIVYGTNWCGDCKRAKQFLAEHLVKFRWIDIDKDAEARTYVERVNKGKRSVPTLVFDDGSILVEPSNAQLAQKLGVPAQAKMQYYDLVVIGGGACGLTASSYAARERIKTLLIERSGLGGQASITDVVENVPGFADKLSGTEFAKQITYQARRFGVEILEADVARIEIADNYRIVHLADGKAINASALLIATGAAYRRLDLPGEDELLGAGVHYCAACDAPFYRGARELLVIGGGDSAVQEALLLTQYAQRITMIVRNDKLSASQTAQEKLFATPSIRIKFNSVVSELRGNKRLDAVVTKNATTGQIEELHPDGMFVFIGMAPNNYLVKDLVTLDSAGYILTGHDLVRAVQQQLQSADAPKHVRMPHAMETNVRGIFAAGDVRSGSSKQVASAVGEGASAAIAIREYLRGE